jgi:hypothetical protein
MRLLAFSAVMLLAVPAAAQNKDERTASDPNKVICRTEEVMGSRLQTARTCLTKQQWAQRREEERRSVQHIQDNKSLNGGN